MRKKGSSFSCKTINKIHVRGKLSENDWMYFQSHSCGYKFTALSTSFPRHLCVCVCVGGWKVEFQFWVIQRHIFRPPNEMANFARETLRWVYSRTSVFMPSYIVVLCTSPFLFILHWKKIWFSSAINHFNKFALP